ncbi:Transcription factor [Nymphaea thermarum]|nr:Transcription factor [Nymphaea thermarum]
MEMSRMTVHLFLRSICNDSGWNYAVFWKPKNQHCMLLTCSEAYYNFPESPNVNSADAGSCFYRNELNHSGGAVSGGSDLQVTIANMSHHVYSLEEGVISHIVKSGRHHWALAEKDPNFVENSELSHGLPDEWKIQFAAGIKTMVLVPVMPYGLVQLGALSTIREDVQLVDHIRSLFIHLHLPSEVGFTVSSVGCLPEMLTLGSGLPASSATSYAPYNLSQQKPWEILFEKAHGLATLDADQAIKSSLLNSEFSNLPMLTVEDDPEMWHKGLYACKFGPGGGHGAGDEMVTDLVPTALAESSHMQNWHMEDNSLYVTAALLNDETQLCNNIEAGRQSRCDTPDQKIFAEIPYASHTLDKNLGQNLICNVTYASHSGSQTFLDDTCSFMSEECAYQLFGRGYTVEMAEAIADDTSKFPDDSELHKALGQTSCQEGASYFCLGTVANLDGSSTGSPTFDRFILQESASDLLGEIKEWLMDGSNSEHLLDAVVADACVSLKNGSASQPTSAKPSDGSFVGCGLHSEAQDDMPDSVADDTVTNFPLGSTDVKPSSHIQEAALAYRKTQTQSNGIQSDFLLHDLERWSYPRRGFISWSEESATIPPLGPQTDDPKGINAGSVLSKDEVKLPKSNKKKSKPGESGRPRPRDRQQIQDRIKELREIVPEGAKCSIDALFERTIKHMLFLRSVTNHVDKLKKCARPKVVNDEGSNSLHSKGATWAVELGSQSGSCPLIVENLSHPGHVLVEMLCEDQGLFLEIAQVIRNLGMTIIKGVTETREDKLWAHFIVEVSRGFQRMDILWPLTQLFQPRHNATLSKF